MVEKRLKALIEKLNLPRSQFPFLYKGTGVSCKSLERVIRKYAINPNFLFGIDEEYRLSRVIPTSQVEKLLWKDIKLTKEEKEKLKKIKDLDFEEFKKVAVSLVPSLKKQPKTILFILYKLL